MLRMRTSRRLCCLSFHGNRPVQGRASTAVFARRPRQPPIIVLDHCRYLGRNSSGGICKNPLALLLRQRRPNRGSSRTISSSCCVELAGLGRPLRRRWPRRPGSSGRLGDCSRRLGRRVGRRPRLLRVPACDRTTRNCTGTTSAPAPAAGRSGRRCPSACLAFPARRPGATMRPWPLASVGRWPAADWRLRTRPRGPIPFQLLGAALSAAAGGSICMTRSPSRPCPSPRRKTPAAGRR